MIIHLSDKLRIRGTEHCWQLEKLKGDDEWRAFKYFTTVDSALHEAAQRELRLSSTTGLSEALAACEAVTAKYAEIFDGVGRHLDKATSRQLAQAEALEVQS